MSPMRLVEAANVVDAYAQVFWSTNRLSSALPDTKARTVKRARYSRLKGLANDLRTAARR